jgi:hypothetical protein
MLGTPIMWAVNTTTALVKLSVDRPPDHAGLTVPIKPIERLGHDDPKLPILNSCTV